MRQVIAAAMVLTAPALCNAQNQSSPAELGIDARWNSRYVSEGRDNLDGDDLISVSGGLSWGQWQAGGWFGAALGQDYQELNLYVERGLELGPVRLYGRYARLDFPADQRDDNELSAGASLTVVKWLESTVDYTYSNEAEGGFLTVSVGASGTVWDRLELSAAALQGFDYGYASESFDGANHREASLEAALHLTGRRRLVGSISHSWALADVERSGGGDLTWGSVGIATRL